MLRGIRLIYWLGWIGMAPGLLFGRNVKKNILDEEELLKNYVSEMEDPPLTLDGLKFRILVVTSFAGPFLGFTFIMMLAGGASVFISPLSWKIFDWTMVLACYGLAVMLINSARGMIAMSDYFRFERCKDLGKQFKVRSIAHPRTFDMAIGLIGPLICYLAVFLRG